MPRCWSTITRLKSSSILTSSRTGERFVLWIDKVILKAVKLLLNPLHIHRPVSYLYHLSLCQNILFYGNLDHLKERLAILDNVFSVLRVVFDLLKGVHCVWPSVNRVISPYMLYNLPVTLLNRLFRNHRIGLIWIITCSVRVI